MVDFLLPNLGSLLEMDPCRANMHNCDAFSHAKNVCKLLQYLLCLACFGAIIVTVMIYKRVVGHLVVYRFTCACPMCD